MKKLNALPCSVWLPIVLAAATCSVQARLGETLAQINQRYGPPSNSYSQEAESDMFNRVYSFNGYTVFVIFVNGKSASELYKKNPGDTFQDSEITALLTANKVNGDWKLDSSDSVSLSNGNQMTRQKWTADSGDLTADLSEGPIATNFLIELKGTQAKYFDVSDKREEEAKAKALKGF